MTESLKRCPFCGSEAEFNSDEFGEGRGEEDKQLSRVCEIARNALNGNEK